MIPELKDKKQDQRSQKLTLRETKEKKTVLKISELWLVWKKAMPNMVPTWTKHGPGMVLSIIYSMIHGH